MLRNPTGDLVRFDKFFWLTHLRYHFESGGKPLALRTNNQGANTMNRLNYLTIRHKNLSKDIENWKVIDETYGERPDVKEMMAEAREELIAIELKLRELQIVESVQLDFELEECPDCPMFLTDGGDRLVCLYCGFEDLPCKEVPSVASEEAQNE